MFPDDIFHIHFVYHILQHRLDHAAGKTLQKSWWFYSTEVYFCSYADHDSLGDL